jgi:hypothetical protein
LESPLEHAFNLMFDGIATCAAPSSWNMTASELTAALLQGIQQSADPRGLFIRAQQAGLAQQLHCVAVEDRRELEQPSNVGHDDAALDERYRLISNTQDCQSPRKLRAYSPARLGLKS